MRANRKAPGKGRDIYQDVTARIIADLKMGVVPWVKPWEDLQGSCPISLPRNPTTGNAYSGVNILLLWASAFDNGHPTQKWMTYKQAQDIGAQVRRGEKSSLVVHVGQWQSKEEKKRAKETGEDAPSMTYLRKYSVFNISQIDGLPEDLTITPAAPTNPIPAIERLIKATGADFRIGGDRAFYAPDDDFIQVPPQRAYSEPIEYYATCLHELTHWTRAKSRLDRVYKTEDGRKDYAREELVAELGAAFLCAHFGVGPILRHADYLGHWLKVLEEDSRAIIKAASAATKAANFILAYDTPEAAAPAVMGRVAA